MPYAAGTCHDCGGTPDEGSSRCAACKRAHRERSAERRAALIEAERCVVCGDPVARTKHEGYAGRRVVRKPARHCKRHLAYYAARERARSQT